MDSRMSLLLHNLPSHSLLLALSLAIRVDFSRILWSDS